jgi:hypothetical protein
MRVRKPNRVTTPRQAVLNGTRTGHASMPRARSRWRPGSARRLTVAHPRPGEDAAAGGCLRAELPAFVLTIAATLSIRHKTTSDPAPCGPLTSPRR